MASPDPRNPGGITAVVESWRRAGLADAVELVELPTSAMGSPLSAKLAQAARATLELGRMLLAGDRPDVVHLHASTGGSLLRKLVLSWCCRLTGAPYVAHEHSGELEEWIGGSSLRRAAAAALYSGAEVTIVLAERWRPTMRALGAKRVEVLPNGLSDAERELLGRSQRARATGPDSGKKMLLFYGRWVPKKGPDRLAAALRRLARTDYELRLYGSGDRERMIETFRGVPGEVTIGGWLAGERKLAELGRAAALIAPSRAEGLPMALVEARAAGTPVIASDVGGVAEALRGYPAARLLDPDDDQALREAIERLLDGEWPGEYEPSEFPAALRSEIAVERLIEIYESVMSRR